MAPPHDFVNCNWLGGQTFDDGRQGSGRVDIEYQARFCVWGIPVFTMGCRPFEHRVHNFQNVVDVTDQCGPLADQAQTVPAFAIGYGIGFHACEDDPQIIKPSTRSAGTLQANARFFAP